VNTTTLYEIRVQQQNKRLFMNIGGRFMTINLDTKLIDNFRNQVNKNSFFRSYYMNKENKNHWNIICSAMDWINVTSEGLPKISINSHKGIGTNHLEALNLMQYIVSIDILVEAIIQLFRVIEPNKEYPLYHERSIFNQKNISDDKYFKQVRAVFGTHQVNLDSLDGDQKIKGKRFYASWPSKGVIDGYDYTVFLYSNNPEKDDLYPFGIVINDLNKYAEERYLLLEMLTNKVELFIIEHRNTKTNEIIEEVNDPIQQLRVLLNENNQRYGSHNGYSNELNYLIQMLQVQLSTHKEEIVEIVKKYSEELIKQIPSIKSALQSMENTDIELTHWTGYATGYEFEKIYSYIFDYHPIGEIYFTKLINHEVLPEYLSATDKNEKQLVLEAVIFDVAAIKGKRITFKELMNSKNL
jgi:hypothetical protein